MFTNTFCVGNIDLKNQKDWSDFETANHFLIYIELYSQIETQIFFSMFPQFSKIYSLH